MQNSTETPEFPLIQTGALASLLLEAQALDSFALHQAAFLSDRACPPGNTRTAFHCLLLLLLSSEREGHTVASDADLLALVPSPEDKDLEKPTGLPEDLHARLAALLDEIASGAGTCYTLVSRQEPLQDDLLHPLVLCQERPGKDRWWGFSRSWMGENRLATMLRGFLETPPAPPQDKAGQDLLWQALQMARPAFTPHPRQWLAVCNALATRFCVISGGPGTGKTTIVQMLVKATSIYHGLSATRMVLCAPTGRAKARLLQGVRAGLSTDDPLQDLEAKTLHALLGISGDGHARWNAENPLPYELVVVDEASMVDVWMFAQLLEALPPAARLVLVGDMDQLPSVDAGAVLGDLTLPLREEGGALSWPLPLRQGFAWLASELPDLGIEFARPLPTAASPLLGHVTFLTRNQRSRPEILDWWNGTIQDKAFASVDDWQPKNLEANSRETLLAHPLFQSFLGSMAALHQQLPRTAKEFENCTRGYRLLSCTNDGEFGRHKLAEAIQPFWNAPYYPLMVERNQQAGGHSLYNGDLGIGGREKGQDCAYFLIDGRIERFELAKLTHVVLAFAITIHKSQGSEFDHVLLAMPCESTRMVSRQLVYTGVTRAKLSLLLNDPGHLIGPTLPLLKRRSRFSSLLT